MVDEDGGRLAAAAAQRSAAMVADPGAEVADGLDGEILWLWPVIRAGAPGVTQQAAAEMQRHAEMRHEAIYRAALGLDQRACVVGAAFLTAAAALVAAAAAIAEARFIAAALTSGAAFTVAAMLCFAAAQAIPFRMPGVQAGQFVTGNFLRDEGPVLHLALAAVTLDATRTAKQQQRRPVLWFNLALAFGAMAPVAGAIALGWLSLA